MMLRLAIIACVLFVACSSAKKEKYVKPEPPKQPEPKLSEAKKNRVYKSGEVLGKIQIDVQIEASGRNGNCVAEKVYFDTSLSDCLDLVKNGLQKYDFSPKYGGTISTSEAEEISERFGKGKCSYQLRFNQGEKLSDQLTLSQCAFGIGKSNKDDAAWSGSLDIVY